MIPKKIHYCWFGGNPLPELAKRCIESWKKNLPDFEIMEWNESNYDVHKNLYISQAFDAKKYAFVSDYARFDILYEQGGIYFDTDVEVLKDMSELISRGSFIGCEDINAISTGLGLGADINDSIIWEILTSYQNDVFQKEDGTYNLSTVVKRVTEIFMKHGFVGKNEIQKVGNFYVYPKEYFCPKDYKTGKLSITENSYSIHHYDGSWTSENQKKFEKKRMKILAKPYPGLISKILVFLSFIKWQISDYGFMSVVKKVRRFF